MSLQENEMSLQENVPCVEMSLQQTQGGHRGPKPASKKLLGRSVCLGVKVSFVCQSVFVLTHRRRYTQTRRHTDA